ncbi:MAG TPA: DUF938 domain-containing protein, partial [Chromatiales bacterium]|nr:DUF938 domain-containing protein [Chromatiales bacterium]
MKPFSESCEQNRAPILAVLQQHLADARRLLEISSGTGQHAVYFAPAFPRLQWVTSDVRANHPGIRAWLAEANLANVSGPLLLDVNQPDWPLDTCDAVFSANTVHIMAWPSVQNLFAGIGRVLEEGGVFCLYGPFNHGGEYTSDSNRRFDAWLRARDPLSGIRDFEALADLAAQAGLA